MFSVTAWINRIIIFHIVCLAWIFFRALTTRDAFQMLGSLDNVAWTADQATAFGFVAIVALMLFVVDLIGEYRSEEYFLQKSSYSVRTVAAFVLIVLVTFFAGANANAFIYFQF